MWFNKKSYDVYRKQSTKGASSFQSNTWTNVGTIKGTRTYINSSNDSMKNNQLSADVRQVIDCTYSYVGITIKDDILVGPDTEQLLVKYVQNHDNVLAHIEVYCAEPQQRIEIGS